MPSLIKKRNKKRWKGVVMVKGRRVEKLFPDNSIDTKRQAVLWEKETKEKLEKQLIDMDCLTILNWAEEYLDYSKEKHDKKTYNEKKGVFAQFFKFFVPNMLVEEINPGNALKYLMAQKKSKSGNKSNKHRKNLATAWKWGRKYMVGFPQNVPNPFREVDKFSAEEAKRYVPPEKDFWKVYNCAEGQDRIMLLAFFYLAARRSEIFDLTWEDVDLVHNKIRLGTKKRKGGNKEYDWLPMTSTLKDALSQWWRIRPLKNTAHVFVCLDNTPFCEQYYGKKFTARRHFMSRLCEKVNVKPFGFHSIRHLAATILYHKGYSISVIQAFLRHKSPTTTNRYLQSLGLEMTRAAIEEGLKGLKQDVALPFEKKKVSGF